MKTRMLEAEKVQAIGGLSKAERMTPGIVELVQLAVPVTKAFREALSRGGIRHWLYKTIDACQRLREANSEAAMGFLVRKGVQTVANDYYHSQPRKWQEYAETVPSTTVAEWYAPLFGSQLALEVERGDQFKEGQIQGEDLSLVNHKFGRIENFERELFDDDQTGQIKQRSQRLGESIATTESVYAALRFVGSAASYGGLSVAASKYATTNTSGTAISTPWSTSMYGSVGNRPSSYVALTMDALKVAYVQTKNAKDPLSNKIIVDTNTLLVSTQDIINAELLLYPGGYPAVIGQTGGVLGGTSTTAGTSQGALTGFPGGINSPNPFGRMGLKLVVEPYFPDWAWALGQNRGFIFQQRDPMEIVQETPNSGANFNFDSIRFRSRERFEVDWIAPRFWYLGCDGTTTGQQ